MKDKLFKIVFTSILCFGGLSTNIYANNNGYTGASDMTDEEINELRNSIEYQNDIKEIRQNMNNYPSLVSGSYKKLNVPDYFQETYYYCGPATAQILLEYVTNKKYSQNELANYMNVTESSGANISSLTRTINDYIGTNMYKTVHKNDISFSYGLSYSIDKDYPVIIHVRPDGGRLPGWENFDFEVGHFIVGNGYSIGFSGSASSSDVYYFDPYDPQSIGQDLQFEYDTFGQKMTSISRMERAMNDKSGFYTMVK